MVELLASSDTITRQGANLALEATPGQPKPSFLIVQEIAFLTKTQRIFVNLVKRRGASHCKRNK